MFGDITSLLFYMFASMLVAACVAVISEKNPIHSVFYRLQDPFSKGVFHPYHNKIGQSYQNKHKPFFLRLLEILMHTRFHRAILFVDDLRWQPFSIFLCQFPGQCRLPPSDIHLVNS